MDGAVAVVEGVALVRAGLDVLLGAELSSLTSLAVADVLALLEVQRRRLDAVDALVVGEVDQRDVAGEFGRTSTADLVSVRCRVDPAEARRRVARARVLAPRVSVSGGVVEPLLPATAVAAVAGVVSAGQVEVIARTMEAIDHLECAVEAAPVVERFLLDAAEREHPRLLARTAALLVNRLDPDGTEPSDAARERTRGFTLDAGRAGRVLGQLTAECAAVWQAILDPLSAPLPAADGTRDERTADHRRHDAFLEAGRMLLRSGQLPDTAGTPTTVLIRATVEEFSAGHGVFQGARGELLSMPVVRAMVDEAEPGLILESAGGQVLGYGRTRRLAAPAQRRALAARDGGCCFPGCDRPPAWAQAHHVISWLDGGATDVDNLCLVCSHHHRLLDRGDWQVVMLDGLPHWLPPPWLDPDRRPVRNTVHHLPKIDFGGAVEPPGSEQTQ